MFSRSVLVSLLVGATVALSACGWLPGENLRFGEANPPQGAVRIDLGHFSCLSEIDARVNDYFNSNLNQENVTQIMNCVRTAIRRFQYLTKGSNDGSYRSESLSTFLNREYLSDRNQLKPSLVAEIMKIKVLALGGDEYNITSSELDEFVELIDIVEKQAIANLPHIRIYRLASLSEEVTESDLLSARNQLRLTARALARILMSHKKVYSLSDLKALIEESRQFLNWENFHTNSYQTDQIIELVKSYKEIATSNSSGLVRDEDWMPIADTAAVLYGHYLNYKLRIDGHSMMFGPPLETLISSVDDVLNLIESLVKSNPNKSISFQATEHLFKSLESVRLLPLGVQAESLNGVYRYLLEHGLTSRGTAIVDPVLGMDARIVNEIRNEFKIWANIQRYLSRRSTRRLLPTLQVVDPDSMMIRSLVNTFDFSKNLNDQQNWDSNSQASALEIENLIKNLRPMFRLDDGRVFISPVQELEQYGVQHNIYNLTYMNVMRALVRILIRTFAEPDRVADMSGITEKEMVEFYRIARPFGVDLKYMDPRKEDSGQRIFTEGKIFTFSGDGINDRAKDKSRLFSFYQIIEYLSLMWSGGQFRDMFYDTISEKCRLDHAPFGELDVFGKPKIDRACFLNHIGDNNLGEFSNLPNMLTYIQQSPSRAGELLPALQEIAAIPCEDARFIEFTEIATMSTVMHYVEVLYSVYDANHDGDLDEYEIMQAYPRFAGYLERQIRHMKNNEFDVGFRKAIFLFLLKYQELPTVKDAPLLYWWKFRYFLTDDSKKGVYANLPSISLDRLALVQVLKALTRSGEAGHKCAPNH